MQPGPPAAPQGSPSRPNGAGGFRRTHVVTADGATVGASPPPGLPPPPRHRAAPPAHDAASESVDSSDTRSTDASSSTASSEQAERRRVQREREAAAAAEANERKAKRKKHRKSHQSGGGGEDLQRPAPAASTPLTAGAIDRAFGVTGAEAHGAGGASAGAGGGLVIQPTTKEGNDAASMYSMSQSILPVDPRDRLYYRPRRHLLQCYLKRKKDGNFMKQLLPVKSCTYRFHLEHTNDFVLAARQQTSKSPIKAEDMSDGIQGRSYEVRGFGNVIFSVNSQQVEKDPRSFVGKLSRRANGSEVVMYSEGNKENRKEICAVRFEGMQDGQRRITVVLPAIDEESGFIRPLEGGQVKFLRDGRGTTLYGTSAADNSSRAGIDAALRDSDDDEVEDDSATTTTATLNAPEFKATGEGQLGMPTKTAKSRSHSLLVREYLRHPTSPGIIVLRNKMPKWDTALRGYQLDFHGRVTKASEKNFQLVPMLQPDKVVMLFGKQGDDKYTVDFRYPLCGLQAAAIASTMMAARTI